MSQSTQKIGLALSGGGFRASFFHIGLLAQMAEQGLLKSVAVISTVSGGSIIGALYYLHLKELLEKKSDKDITDADFIKIIQTIEVDFLKATENNIRMRVLANIKNNFQMRNNDYSHSERIAELYNDLIYQPVTKDLGNPIEMQKLKIQPLGEPTTFHPEKHNKDRSAKVPILILNATTLNTGRNWQFTARTMGEPPTPSSHIDIDKKPIRLRRATGDGYQKMVESQQNFRLGNAVAASACVPGLFDPLTISNLYFDKDSNQEIVPQLVDGGVFDNQGIESLITTGCTHFIVSDASGQMGVKNEVETDPVSVALRTSSILQDRVRTEGILHLIATKGEENIAFIDLRKGLGEREICWTNQDNQHAENDTITAPTSEEFGVAATVQQKLSLMRTDLDAFTEVEAYSLMFDAYQMSKLDLKRFKKTTPQQPEANWKFAEIAELMKSPQAEYLTQLENSEAIFGKTLHIFKWLWIPIILTVAVTLFYTWAPFIKPLLGSSFTVYAMLFSLFLWLATIFSPKLEKAITFLTYLRPHALLMQRWGKALLLILLTFFVKFYLKFINPMYLAQGRIAALKKKILNTAH